MVDVWWLLPFFLLGAALYTSVGHGGATIYLAILVLAGWDASGAASTVLVLNIVAAALAFVQFRQAGHLRPTLLLPFLVTSVPAAFLGGTVRLPPDVANAVLGAALLLAAVRFLAFPSVAESRHAVADVLFFPLALLLGLGLGFAAGATGIGGGIFLSPVLVLLGWATVREAASVASAFIVLNSLAGLGARLPRQPLDIDLLLPTLATVAAGALVGAHMGARRLPPRALQTALGVVLAAAVVRIALDLDLLGRLKGFI